MSHGVYPTPSAHSGLIQRNTSSSSRSLAGCYLSLALNLKHRGNSDCLWEPQHIFSYEFRFCILNDRRVFKPKLLQVPHVNVDYSCRGSRAASQLRAGLMTFAHFFFSSCTDLLVKKKEREREKPALAPLSWLILILWPAQVRRTHSRKKQDGHDILQTDAWWWEQVIRLWQQIKLIHARVLHITAERLSSRITFGNNHSWSEELMCQQMIYGLCVSQCLMCRTWNLLSVKKRVFFIRAPFQCPNYIN